ncbi:hypothetical protein C1634_025155, partial [Chryseobacterium viscerum]
SSGTLSENTTVGQGIHTLAFTSGATNGFSVDGATFSVDAANDRLGVGTVSPKVTLDVAARATDGSAAEGLKVPMLTGNALYAAATNGKYTSSQDGAIVHVTTAADLSKRTGQTEYIDSSGLYYFNVVEGTSGKWIKLGSGTTTASVMVDCNANAFVGNYSKGIAMMSSNKFSVTITNNTFSTASIAFQASDLSLSGVSGITVVSVTPVSASLNGGQSQLVEYTLSGTPTSSSLLTGEWRKLSLNCVKTVPVIDPTVTSFNCSGATNTGSLSSGVSASGVSSVISYTGGNAGVYSGQSVSSTGVTGLTATLSSGTLANGNGSVSYTISGTPSGSGTASFLISIGGQSCTFTRTVALSGAISSLSCSGATNTGSLSSGVSASGVSSVISYTGGNAGVYSGQSVSSTGVTGLTATLSSGTLANGNGSVSYTISGTPSGSGTASFLISIGGQSCTFTRTVISPIPANITLAQNRMYMVASIYDKDYLPYTAPAGAATSSTQAADGTNESVTVNVQGNITTTGVMVTIPVTATGSGTLSAYSTTITVSADKTEDGISRDLMLSWTSQAYTSVTTSITATIKAIGGTLNAKKLDINAGIGNDTLGILLGQFMYPYNNAGNITNYNIRDIAGIPDKVFATPQQRRMLYLPIVAEDGNIWLNNNLGASYSNVDHPSFNLAQQATSSYDLLSYGSRFQWGRRPDGHELIDWINNSPPGAYVGKLRFGTSTFRSDLPTNVFFIINALWNGDWRVTTDLTLWASESSPNNPCPLGFRVPKYEEFKNLFSYLTINNYPIDAAFNSTLKISVGPSVTHEYGVLSGNNGYWASNTLNEGQNFSALMYLQQPFPAMQIAKEPRANGLAVRCIKD